MGSDSEGDTFRKDLPMASNFKDKLNSMTESGRVKFDSFMARRNGPDAIARDVLALAIVLFVLGVVTGEGARTFFVTLGIVAFVYMYWRIFSTNIAARRSEDETYSRKRAEVLAKVGGPFKSAAKRGQTAATRAKDREHRYFECPKCHQTVRVPKGAGKVKVTCPKCGEKFEKKA